MITRPTDPSYSEMVWRKLSDELEAYASSHGKTHVYESLARTSEHISVSYKGRTLIELIQNGYDAHPASQCDGEISILLDSTEGSYGCLYVANRGLGFEANNFNGICNIALSPKTVNHGIGNKGLGFKSVQQVCGFPEIFSQDGIGKTADDFFGFCFRFPHDDELRDLLEEKGHAEYVDEILINFPRWLLPVPADNRSNHVLMFAEQGFATVIRMPLERNEAQIDIREQIDLIKNHELPVHLFLERIEKIQIRVIEEVEEESSCHALLRRSLESWQENDIAFELIQIDQDSTYLVSKRDLPDDEFRTQLLAGIKSDELPESWREWEEPATICVAVRTDSAGDAGRLYNFLPMTAVAESPCAAHINAPFLCDLDRTKLVDNVGLNTYFLEQIAALCLKATENIKQTQPELAINAVPDLIMWVGGYTDLMAKISLAVTDHELKSLPIVPSSKGSVKFPWTTLEEAFAWPQTKNPLKILSPARVAKVAGTDIVDPAIEKNRLSRINKVAEYLTDQSLDPPGEVLAEWAEKVANDFLATHTPTKTWNDYYEDLTVLFADNADELRDKKILLTADEQLAHTMTGDSEEDESDSRPHRKTRSRAIFLPNTRSQQSTDTELDDSVNVEPDSSETLLVEEMPPSLNKSIQLVHSKLSCAQRKDESGVREFLINHGLVYRFQTEDLQRLLANLTAKPGPGANPHKRRMEALRYAFQLSDQGRRGSELHDMRFHVPARNGEWIPAREAYFGSEWPGTRGADLEELIDVAQSASEELGHIGEAMIANFASWPSKSGGRKDWIIFLLAIGIRDTFRVSNARPRGKFRFQGYQLRGALPMKIKLRGSAYDFWAEELPTEIRNPYTEYTVSGRIPVLPGLNDYDRLSISARRLFAREILAILNMEGEALLTITVLRPNYRVTNKTLWPSPVGAFLRQAEWLPVRSPNPEKHFGRLQDVWHLPQSIFSIRPDFLPIVENDCRHLLEIGENARNLLQNHCGLNVINSPVSAATQVLQLGKLASNSEVGHSAKPSFDALYAEGWGMLAKDTGTLEDTLDSQPLHLAVHRGSEIEGFQLTRKTDHEERMGEELSSPTVYLADDKVPTTRDLLRDLDKPVFDFKFDGRSRVAKYLSERFENLQLISSVQLVVYADGSLVHPTSDAPLLVTPETRWLQDAILIIIDLSANFLNIGSAGFEKMRACLARLRYRLVNQIEIEIDHHRIELPRFTQGCLLYNDDEMPIILIQTEAESLSWTVMQQASHAIAEALGVPTQLSTVLGSAFAQLTQLQGPGALASPSNDNFQVICRKGKQAVEESKRGLRHIIEILIEFLLPVIKTIADYETFEDVRASTEQIANEEDLATLLESYQDKICIDIDSILDACRKSDTINDVRRTLGIELVEFNEAIGSLGAPYQAINYAEDQQFAFHAYVKNINATLYDCLRGAFVGKFDAKEPLDAYVIAHELPDLVAKSEWAESFDSVPNQLMESVVNEWLASYDASPLNKATPIEGLPLEECRESNRKQLRKLAIHGWTVVTAWCRKNGSNTPTVWQDRSEVAQALGKIAHAGGWMDFRLLDDAAIIEWLIAENAWPDGMPRTRDLDVLELSPDEIDDAADQARNHRREKARLANTITVGNKEISIDQPNLADMLDEVLIDFENNNELWLPQNRIARLDQLEVKSKKMKGGNSNPSSGSHAPRDLPSGQKMAIGLLGEKIAFEWLKRQYPTLLNEECWVSRNRELVLQTGSGNDLLGYDFIVRHPDHVRYYEVKATTSDNQFFRLGPTEVEAAIKYRTDGKHRFRILFVHSVTEPERTRIHLLPNPYTEKYKNRFRLVTKGEVGLRFSLT